MRFKIALLVLALASFACSANVTTFNTLPSATPEIIAPIVTDSPQSEIGSPLDSQPVVVPDAISSLQMLDAQKGWLITDATVLQTQDGGSTWHNVTPPGAHALGSGTGASFLDSDRGWILIADPSDPANKGILYHTTDGGIHWNSNTVPFGGGEIHFLDDLNGWMMLSDEVLTVKEPAQFFSTPFEGVKFFQSSDGGVNWTQVYTNMPDDAGAGDSLPYRGLKTGFTPINMQEAWVNGLTNTINDFYLYHTMDGGHTWSLTDHRLPFTEERYQVYPPVFLDAQFGILPFFAGSDGGMLLFSFTEDGGKTWTTREASVASSYSVDSPDNVFASFETEPWGLVSTDAGRSWTRIHTGVNFDAGDTSLLQLQFVDAQTGWAVVRDDTDGHTSLYKTIDGGQTWIAQVE